MSTCQRKPRRGVVIVPVLVCFILILAICAALLKLGSAQRGQLAAEERRLQAEWLVESGVERAAAALARSREYKGETWAISAKEMNGPWPGLVTIQVERDPADRARKRVVVVAEYPRNADLRSKQRKVISLEGGAQNTGKDE